MLFVLPLAAIATGMVVKRMLSEGRIYEACWWRILQSCIYIVLDGWIAWYNPRQAGILFLVIPAVKTIVSSTREIRRIGRGEVQ